MELTTGEGNTATTATLTGDTVTHIVVKGPNEKGGGAQNEQPADGDKIRGDMKEFIMDLELHGLRRVMQSRSKIAKCAWCILFSSSLLFLIYYITDRVLHYYTYPYATKVSVQELNKIEFPAVSLCHMNEAQVSAHTYQDFLSSADAFGFDRTNLSHVRPKDLSTSQWEFFKGYVDRWKSENASVRASYKSVDYREYLARTGHKPVESITRCYYYPLYHASRGRDGNCRKWWRRVFMYPFGTCFTLNNPPGVTLGIEENEVPQEQNESLVTTHKGIKFGLTMKMKTHRNEFNHKRFTTSGGIKFLIHEPHALPDVNQNGIILSPGHLIYSPITSITKVVCLPKPFTECVNKNYLRYYTSYSVAACERECITNLLQSKFNCIRYDYPGELPVCNYSMQLKFTAEEAIILNSNVCKRNCISPCRDTIYQYDAHPVAFADVKNRSEEITLLIYFENLVEVSYQDVAVYTVPDLLSSVGGMMGLFLGASILTIIHILEYTCRNICNK